MNTQISCPNCHFTFDVDQVLAQNAENRIRSELQAAHERALQESAKKHEQELAALKTKLTASARQAAKAEYEAAQAELADRLKNADVKLQARDEQLEKLRQQNLDFLREKEKWAQEKQNLELENRKQLAAERDKLTEQISKKVEQENQLRLAEKDKKLADAMAEMAVLRRKLEQGSQQSQGEVLELALEDQLREAFGDDIIEPIGKGVNGADVRQRVFNTKGSECGKIIWECKRTKNWTEGWISKLKDDQRQEKAELAVLTTTQMPKNVDKDFTFYQGIWVCKPELATFVATLLRFNLIRIGFVLDSQESKDEKVEALYRYLTGPEFSQKIESQYDTIAGMRAQLEKEKTFWNRHFAEREKQIEALSASVVSMYGGLQGITRGALPSVKSLEGE